MLISRDDRVRMERAHVRAWPALSTAVFDGWLWRSSGGGSQRANSVSTVDFHGNDLDGAVDAVEARYRACGRPSWFQTYDETAPSGLAERLRARGYQALEPTKTLFKRVQPVPAPADIDCREQAWPAWLDVYTEAITRDRRAANARILGTIPAPRAFFGCRRNGEVIATALCVVSFGCVVIECVATGPSSRRRGAARAVLAATQNWAARQNAAVIGLQVASANAPAMALYETAGFTAGATNTFWQKT